MASSSGPGRVTADPDAIVRSPIVASSQARTRSGTDASAQRQASPQQPHRQLRHVERAVALGLFDPFIDQAAGQRVFRFDLADHVEDPAPDVAPERRGPAMGTVPDRDHDGPAPLAVEPR